METFLRAKIRDLFQAAGNTPSFREALNNLVRYWAIDGNALAIRLYGMPSSPLA